MRIHEESFQGKKSSILIATRRIQKQDHQVTSQIATIMGTLIQPKRQISMLEAKCTMLHNMVINLSKGEQSGESNQVQSINSNCGPLGEDEIVLQLPDNVEIVKVDSNSTKATQDEATSQHAFF